MNILLLTDSNRRAVVMYLSIIVKQEGNKLNHVYFPTF